MHISTLIFDRLTCVYLASKVEEFNVSINQFVGNLKGDREKFANIILTFELLLMDKLNYHLLIHNPYRPMEGLFIDLKVRVQHNELLDYLHNCFRKETFSLSSFKEKTVFFEIHFFLIPMSNIYNDIEANESLFKNLMKTLKKEAPPQKKTRSQKTINFKRTFFSSIDQVQSFGKS